MDDIDRFYVDAARTCAGCARDAAVDGPSSPRVPTLFTEAVLAETSALLRDAWGTPVELEVESELRSHVARVRVAAGSGSLPATVIVRAGPDRVGAGTPDDGIGWAAAFGNEVAGLVFLNAVDETAPFVPDLLADDLERQIVVVEDLGTGASLADLLLGSDPDPAIVALVEHAQLLGHIAATTRDRVDEYRDIRQRVGYLGPASLLDELTTAEVRGVLDRTGADLGLAVGADLDAELASIDAWLADPGAWLAYTPADACPDNNVWDGHRLRLFDFGFGGLRHLALDAAYSVIPFPTCWCYAPLPAGVTEAMLEAFWAEVATTLPDADDPAVRQRQLAFALGAWFSGFVAMIAEREAGRMKQRGPLPGRDAVVAQMEVIADRVRDHLPATAELAGGMAAQLRSLWNVDHVPTYPALRRGQSRPDTSPA
jgi:hypothetical protein